MVLCPPLSSRICFRISRRASNRSAWMFAPPLSSSPFWVSTLQRKTYESGSTILLKVFFLFLKQQVGFNEPQKSIVDTPSHVIARNDKESRMNDLRVQWYVPDLMIRSASEAHVSLWKPTFGWNKLTRSAQRAVHWNCRYSDVPWNMQRRTHGNIISLEQNIAQTWEFKKWAYHIKQRPQC